MPFTGKQILVIDDTASIRTFLRISLQAHGAVFHEAASAAEGLAIFAKVKPDLIVLDISLPDKGGLEILADLKADTEGGSSPKIVILSVNKEQSTKDKAFFLGADAYLTKPFLMEELVELLEQKLGIS